MTRFLHGHEARGFRSWRIMKIRSGFVSNSSSSSFCIYGTTISKEDVEKITGEKYDYDTGKLEEITELECIVLGESDAIYIGRSYSSIRDDESGKQFKDSVENALKKALGREVKCDTQEEAWYNG
jgi:hypothetical protein